MQDIGGGNRLFRVPAAEFTVSLSKALDLVSPSVYDHHLRVAYLSASICEQMALPAGQAAEITVAASLHDVGVLNLSDKLLLARFDNTKDSHPERGYLMLSQYKPLEHTGLLLRYHHTDWQQLKEAGKGVEDDVVLGNSIIHVADRAAVLVDADRSIMSQVDFVRDKIEAHSGTRFDPQVVEALAGLSTRPAVWFDLVSPHISELMSDRLGADASDLGVGDLLELAMVYSSIIDFRSRYTSTHSAGVAATSQLLGELFGLTEDEQDTLKVSGYLHDIGKLAVPNEILEKPDELTSSEYQIILSHPYYSYRVLEPVTELADINEWASFHHERLDGSGYPFGHTGRMLQDGSRIVAVADVFAAVAEDRPYRPAMPPEAVREVMKTSSGLLDREVVDLLLESFDEARANLAEARASAAARYDNVFNAIASGQ